MTLATTTALDEGPAPHGDPTVPTLEDCARALHHVVVTLAALEAVPCSESHELLLEQAERLREFEVRKEVEAKLAKRRISANGGDKSAPGQSGRVRSLGDSRDLAPCGSPRREAGLMRAITAAVDAALTQAAAIGAEDQLEEPGVRLELARRLRAEAAVLQRQAAVLEALATGLGISAEVDVDNNHEMSTAEEEGG
jgi:hypothetical protein